MPDELQETQKELRAAWDDMLASLNEARDAIDQPELMPAPANERNLAEGYRYLIGFLHNAIERSFHSDKTRPAIRNILSIFNRATIDNSDAIYFSAAIDGREQYCLRGQVEDSRVWRGEDPRATGRLAPHYVIFEASSGVMAGDSGDLRELIPGVKAQTGSLDSSAIMVDISRKPSARS